MKKSWVISSLEDLPTLPSLGIAIKEQILESGSSLETLFDLIRCDPVTSLLVLREANSETYQRSGQVNSLRESATLIGLETFRSLLLSTPLLHEDQCIPHGPGFDVVKFWNHSRAVAYLSAELHKKLSSEQSEPAYMAGLLHDIGKFIIQLNFPPSRSTAAPSGTPEPDPLGSIMDERAVLGTDHASLASLLFTRWRLPSMIIQSASRHHAGYDSGALSDETLLYRIVFLANKIAYHLGYGCHPERHKVDLGDWEFSLIGLTPSQGFRAIDEWGENLRSLQDFPLSAGTRENLINTLERANSELGRIHLSASAPEPSGSRTSTSMLTELCMLCSNLSLCRDSDAGAIRLMSEFFIRMLRYMKICFHFTSQGDTAETVFEAFRNPEGEVEWRINTGQTTAVDNEDNAGQASLQGPHQGLRLQFATEMSIQGLPTRTLYVWDSSNNHDLPPALVWDRERLREPLLRLCRVTLERVHLDENCQDELSRIFLEKEKLRLDTFRRQQLSEFSQQIIKKAPIGLFSIDAEGYLTSANPAFLGFFDLEDAEDYRSVNLLQLPSVTRCGLDRELSISLGTGKPFEINDLQYISRSGQEYVLRVQMVPQGRPGDESSGLIGIAEEVTLKKKLEQNLIQIERLRALGEMAGSVAHDFNNLLGAILGNTQLLLNMTSDPSLVKKLEVIEQVTVQGAEKVKRLQEFTRIRKDRSFELIDVEPIIRQSLDLIDTRAQAQDVRVSLNRDRRRLPAILGNAGELREAFFNILLNSLDAMPEGGKLTVKTETDRSSVSITFDDSGCGMADDIKHRVFEPFFTTKGAQGSGLGMSMVYGIVTRHNGEIHVHSTPDVGTSLVIRIPVDRTPGETEERRESVSKARKQTYRILVIDDEEVMRNALVDILRIGNYEVSSAPDGESGLELFRREHFDMVVSDMSMPGISGRDVLQQVKRDKPGTAAILISGWGLEMDPDEMATAGVDRIIHKPFQLKEVLNLVGDTLGNPEY